MDECTDCNNEDTLERWRWELTEESGQEERKVFQDKFIYCVQWQREKDNRISGTLNNHIDIVSLAFVVRNRIYNISLELSPTRNSSAESNSQINHWLYLKITLQIIFVPKISFV